MKYSINFLKWHDTVEHIAFVQIDHWIIEVFVPYCPTPISEKSTIKTHLEAEIFDAYSVNPSDKDIGIYKLDQGLSYALVGILKNGIITIDNIHFLDDILLSHYGYLNGRKIEWKIDRFNLILN